MASSDTKGKAKYDHLLQYVPPEGHEALKFLSYPDALQTRWLSPDGKAGLKKLHDLIPDLPVVKMHYLFQERLYEIITSDAAQTDHHDATERFIENLDGTRAKLKEVVEDLFGIWRLLDGCSGISTSRRTCIPRSAGTINFNGHEDDH
ncbi:MAG: hypothetical protein L6R38_001438 [Xanthoria sp. 2 TBL-2021]|nr:MAG: hypothetical protein L6R38_001438 [Xanthoria sp. 2 TBL-2021]